MDGWRRTAEPGDAAAADKCRKEKATAKRATTYLWFLNHFHRPRLVQTVHAELSPGPGYSSATCVSSTCGNMQTLGFSELKYSENADSLYHFNGI